METADGGEPVPVAHLSYTHGFNGYLPPEGKEWMGNQIAGQSTPPIDPRREGVMARVEFTEAAPGEWESGTLEAIPTWVSLDPGLHLVDLATALADEALPESDREVHQGAYDRIMGHVNGLGVSSDPDFATVE